MTDEIISNSNGANGIKVNNLSFHGQSLLEFCDLCMEGPFYGIGITKILFLPLKLLPLCFVDLQYCLKPWELSGKKLISNQMSFQKWSSYRNQITVSLEYIEK